MSAPSYGGPDARRRAVVPGASYRATTEDREILVDASDGPRVVTLPPFAACEDGARFVIRDAHGHADTHPITVATDDGTTINGAGAWAIHTRFACVSFEAWRRAGAWVMPFVGAGMRAHAAPADLLSVGHAVRVRGASRRVEAASHFAHCLAAANACELALASAQARGRRTDCLRVALDAARGALRCVEAEDGEPPEPLTGWECVDCGATVENLASDTPCACAPLASRGWMPRSRVAAWRAEHPR